MDKKEIIDAILKKQNSISDKSSCSGFDIELKKPNQKRKEPIIQKEETVAVFDSENT